MNSELVDWARALGFMACAESFERFDKMPEAAPPDPALSLPPATDAVAGLAQLVRRGLELASGVSLVSSALSADPIARGLLAWDVLNGSFVPRGA